MKGIVKILLDIVVLLDIFKQDEKYVGNNIHFRQNVDLKLRIEEKKTSFIVI